LRVFIAALLPAEVTGYIGSYVDSIRHLWEGVRWERPERFHITLKFLGDIDKDAAGGIIGVVESSSESVCAFDMSFEKMGGFPNLKNPRVIYVGMKNNDALSAFHEEIEGKLEGMGYPREERSFTPHVTVGRVRGRARLMGSLPYLQSIDFRISSIGVIKSVLSTGGSEYTPIGVFNI